jgi:hypothetical protein
MPTRGFEPSDPAAIPAKRACLHTCEATEREALVNPTPSVHWFLADPGPDAVAGVGPFEPTVRRV